MELLRPLDSSNDVLKTAFDEMIDLERQFLDELEKKFSLTTDIRSYESIIVRLKSGKVSLETHKNRKATRSGCRHTNSAILAVLLSNLLK